MEILDAQFLAGATQQQNLPAPAFAEVAFAGRSNVGKSSLINTMVRRKKLVRTSSTPGCTRQLNLFRVKLRKSAIVDFVDLPGYGYAKRSKQERYSWGPMIEGFLEHRVGLRGVILLVDVRRGLQAEEVQLVEFMQHLGGQVLLVATKVDRVPKNKRRPLLAKLKREAGDVIGFSSTTGEGRDELWDAILSLCSIDLTDAAAEPA